MARERGELQLELEGTIDEVFDELSGSNSFLALRKLRWSPNSEYRLDIRKWFTNSNGEEIAGKGVSFMTEEGPANLIQALLKNGYGDTRKTLEGIKDRDDFIPTLSEMIRKDEIHDFKIPEGEEESNSSFYDPKEIL